MFITTDQPSDHASTTWRTRIGVNPEENALTCYGRHTHEVAEGNPSCTRQGRLPELETQGKTSIL